MLRRLIPDTNQSSQSMTNGEFRHQRLSILEILIEDKEVR
jgi:hypothetical protein